MLVGGAAPELTARNATAAHINLSEDRQQRRVDYALAGDGNPTGGYDLVCKRLEKLASPTGFEPVLPP